VGAAAVAKASTVLIVDDEARNRKLLEALLQADGYLTVSAGDAEQALKAIAHATDVRFGSADSLTSD
jgi:CheY-like chemotaxis protein